MIEPIDLIENPPIYLASVSDGFEIVRAVNMPQLKLLYDFYHEQRSFGNLIEKLEKNVDLYETGAPASRCNLFVNCDSFPAANAGSRSVLISDFKPNTPCQFYAFAVRQANAQAQR